MKRHQLLTVMCLTLLLSASAARAGIVSLGVPPASVLKGALSSNTDIYTFAEQQDILLGAPVAVDITAAGLYAPFIPLSPGVIPQGTLVRSYLFHADSPSLATQFTNGSIAFSKPILGVIVSDAGLDATDALLGLGSVQYPTGYAFRGLEFSPLALLTPDLAFISGNMLNLSLLLNTSTRVDQLRVITAGVPEPTTWALAALGLGCVGLISRRRRGA